MKRFTSGRYAAVASTAALVVALGGTSYAASQITSSDIKDGTIQTKDINPNARITVKQIHNDASTALTGSTKTVLSLNLPKGTYLLAAKGNVYAGAGGYGECWLTNPVGVTVDIGWFYSSAAIGYGEVVNSAVVTLGHTGTVQMNCYGSDASLDDKKLTATRVASAVNLTGANVAKVPTQHLLQHKG